jgi:hypothetical protein
VPEIAAIFLCEVGHGGGPEDGLFLRHGWREWSRRKDNRETTMDKHELSTEALNDVAGGMNHGPTKPTLPTGTGPTFPTGPFWPTFPIPGLPPIGKPF